MYICVLSCQWPSILGVPLNASPHHTQLSYSKSIENLCVTKLSQFNSVSNWLWVALITHRNTPYDLNRHRHRIMSMVSHLILDRWYVQSSWHCIHLTHQPYKVFKSNPFQIRYTLIRHTHTHRHTEFTTSKKIIYHSNVCSTYGVTHSKFLFTYVRKDDS